MVINEDGPWRHGLQWCYDAEWCRSHFSVWSVVIGEKIILGGILSFFYDVTGKIRFQKYNVLEEGVCPVFSNVEKIRIKLTPLPPQKILPPARLPASLFM